MTREITVRIFDEVKCAFYGLDREVIEQLVDDYAIFMDGYRFVATYQIGKWDGKKQFFTKNGATYLFLLPKIIKKLKSWGYKNIRYVMNGHHHFMKYAQRLLKMIIFHILSIQKVTNLIPLQTIN